MENLQDFLNGGCKIINKLLKSIKLLQQVMKNKYLMMINWKIIKNKNKEKEI